MNLLLTTYPAHKSRNVGDSLISKSAEALVRTHCGDVPITTVFREQPIDDHVSQGVNAIIAPGFSVANATYPGTFALTRDLQTLPPFYPVGCAIQHADFLNAGLEGFRYDQPTLDVLNLIVERSGAFPCRDQLIVDLLAKFDIPGYYFGDLGLFDADQIGRPFVAPKRIGSLVFTIAHSPRYAAQSAEMLEQIARAFPKVRRYAAHHSVPNSSARAIADIALKHGFEIVELAGSAENLNFYDDIDVHIGYRLHGHISFLRRRKPSVLLAEDIRSFGFYSTEGTQPNCIPAFRLSDFAADPGSSATAMTSLLTGIEDGFSSLNSVFSFVDTTYKNVVSPYFSNLKFA